MRRANLLLRHRHRAVPNLDPMPDAARADPFDDNKFQRLMDETSQTRKWLAARQPLDESLTGYAHRLSGNTAPRIAALDDRHKALLRELFQRPEWSLTDLKVLASRLGLMPHAAIATIIHRRWFKRTKMPTWAAWRSRCWNPCYCNRSPNAILLWPGRRGN